MSLKVHFLLMYQFVVLIQFLESGAELRMRCLVIMAFGAQNQPAVFSGRHCDLCLIHIALGTVQRSAVDGKNKLSTLF